MVSEDKFQFPLKLNRLMEINNKKKVNILMIMIINKMCKDFIMEEDKLSIILIFNIHKINNYFRK